VLLPGRAFYVWGSYSNCGNYPPVLKVVGLYFSQAIIWDKQHPVLTRKDYMGAHEWCFYGWREGAAHQFFGPANATDLWSVRKLNHQSMVHLTEKPVELVARALEYSARPGEHVLDLFAGSGSTLIAAEQIGRRALLMEPDPLYCDVIVRRYEQFSGRQAARQAAARAAGPGKECGQKRRGERRYAMAGRGRHRADEALLLALACGATAESAAAKAGVSLRTVRRRLADPAFRRRLQQQRGDLVQRTSGALTAAGPEALRTLLELQTPAHPAAVRLGAARAVLELGLKVRQAADLEARLAALEERLADRAA
jgi:hypothetical protein